MLEDVQEDRIVVRMEHVLMAVVFVMEEETVTMDQMKATVWHLMSLVTRSMNRIITLPIQVNIMQRV